MKRHVIVLACVTVAAGGCASSSNFDAQMQQSMRRSVEQRSASAEFQSAVKKGKLVFYGIGSGLEGLSLPGLTKEEVAFVVSQGFAVVSEFPTDPVPLWASKEYWDAVDRFASAYNRLVYQHLAKTEPNKTVEDNSVCAPRNPGGPLSS